jgi:phosphatidylserine decarboxylase
MKNNLFPIAKEGWKFIGFSVLAVIIFSIIGFEFLQFLSFLAIIFFAFVFRNPERQTPEFEQNSVVSPVDGVILSIEEITNSEYAYKVEIESSYLNVSILRIPLSSSVKTFNIQRGSRLSRFDKLAQKINEKAEIVFEDKQSNMVKVEHVLKRSFNDIQVGVIEAQNSLQGARYGVMINGITTLYLPQNFRLNVSVGNELKASETLIGYFS